MAQYSRSHVWYNPLIFKSGGRMRRQESTELTTGPTAIRGMPGSMTLHPWGGFVGFIALTLAMLLSASSGFAEFASSPARPAPAVSESPSPSPAVPQAVSSATDGVELADPLRANSTEPKQAEGQLAVSPPNEERLPTSLVKLLRVPQFGASSWQALTTDELLAAAVATGTNADLEPLNPFRKRKRDLFVSERPVSIGNTEMLLRLRVRAKARRAMSVELRF